MAKAITKAVFPAAGLGTRFLPATKANPKEMLPVVDKPLIQYAAEEAIEAGIKELIFIIGRNKTSIPDHFDKAYELEQELESRNKQQLLECIRNIVPNDVSCVYIRQADALGLGHAVQCAAPVVGEEPFAVILADDLIKNNGKNCLKQLIDVYNDKNASVIGVQKIDPSDTDKYGIVIPAEAVTQETNAVFIEGIVEKPSPAEAPSDMGVVGRYILTPGIFKHLATIKHGSGGELQLTDAIASLLDDEKICACEFEGIRYDCGSKLGYLMATVEYALEHEQMGEEFASYLKSIVT